MISTEPIAHCEGLYGQKACDTFLADMSDVLLVSGDQWQQAMREAYEDDTIQPSDIADEIANQLYDRGFSVLWREGDVFIYNGEIDQCRSCERVTRVDDEPVDTDAADGWNGYCGSCADRMEGEKEGSTDD